MRRDAGSGSVLAIALVGASALALVTIGTLGRLAIESIRLQRVVDLAAIAANQTLRGLNTGLPCQNAEAIFTLNMVKGDKCLIVGDDTKVAAHLELMGIVLVATATAAANARPSF